MLAKVRGSLYYAVLFVSVVFAAATGIVGASVTILGIMAAKSMNKSGYNVRLAAGTITAGGTLRNFNPTKHYACCDGSNNGNSCNRFICCSNYTRNYCLQLFMRHTQQLDVG